MILLSSSGTFAIEAEGGIFFLTFLNGPLLQKLHGFFTGALTSDSFIRGSQSDGFPVLFQVMACAVIFLAFFWP